MATILHIAPCPFPLHQGSQVFIRGLAEAQHRLGHTVLVASYHHGSGRSAAGVQVVRGHRVPGVRHERSGFHWSKIIQDLSLARVVRRTCSSVPVDVVHGHNVEGPLVARLAGVSCPLIYTVHTAMRDELPTYVRRGRRPLRLLGQVIDEWVPRISTAAMTLSEGGTRARSGFPVHTCPPGVDLEELGSGCAERARQRWQLGSSRWVVYVGNTDGYQDLNLLVDAMKQVQGAGLLMVSGDSAVTLQRAVASAGVPVRVVRSRDFQDTLDALSVATCAVIPRTRCAGFPMKLLNQLGVGCPTIGLVGATPPLPGVVLTTPGQLGQTIQHLMHNPDQVMKLGRDARAGIETGWTWSIRAAAVDELYRELGLPL